MDFCISCNTPVCATNWQAMRRHEVLLSEGMCWEDLFGKLGANDVYGMTNAPNSAMAGLYQVEMYKNNRSNTFPVENESSTIYYQYQMDSEVEIAKPPSLITTNSTDFPIAVNTDTTNEVVISNSSDTLQSLVDLIMSKQRKIYESQAALDKNSLRPRSYSQRYDLCPSPILTALCSPKVRSKTFSLGSPLMSQSGAEQKLVS